MAEKVLDEEFENEMKEKVDKRVKSAKTEMETAKERALQEIEGAKTKIDAKSEEVSESVREKPLEWVAGAFVGGLILGKLLSK